MTHHIRLAHSTKGILVIMKFGPTILYSWWWWWWWWWWSEMGHGSWVDAQWIFLLISEINNDNNKDGWIWLNYDKLLISAPITSMLLSFFVVGWGLIHRIWFQAFTHVSGLPPSVDLVDFPQISAFDFMCAVSTLSPFLWECTKRFYNK